MGGSKLLVRKRGRRTKAGQEAVGAGRGQQSDRKEQGGKCGEGMREQDGASGTGWLPSKEGSKRLLAEGREWQRFC